MKLPNKNNKLDSSKGKIKKKPAINKPRPKNDKVLVVAQEIKYARLLCSNEKKTRDKVLKALKKWLVACFVKKYEFKEEDFVRVWKGLFYAVWMADKPLVQEDLCDNIASILDYFPPEQLKHALLMMKAGFKTLASEWYGIDHHRMDKFLMLVRRYLRGSLRILKRCEWDVNSCEQYAQMMSGTDGIFAPKTPYYARNALSMLLHVADCYLEEVAKVSNGEIPDDSLVALFRPIVTYTCIGEQNSLVISTKKVLIGLCKQTDKSLEYEERVKAWEQMGCPEGGPEALELVAQETDADEQENDHFSDDEIDERSSKPLDPRAGRVNVELASLPVPADMFAAMLRDMLNKTSSKAHKRIKNCLQRFEHLMKGEVPFPVVENSGLRPERFAPLQQSALALASLEAKLKADADDLKLRGLSRKHRKRLLRKTRAGISIVEDIENITNNKMTDKPTNGEWKIETVQEKSTSNKENEDKKAKKRKSDSPSPVAEKKQKLQNKHKIKNNKVSLKDSKRSELKSKKTKSNLKSQKEPKIKSTQNEIKTLSVSQEKTKSDEVKTVSLSQEKSKESHLKSDKQSRVKTVIQNGTDKTKIHKKTFQQQTKISDKKVKNDFKKESISLKSKSEVKVYKYETPKKVKFVLKNNSMQKPVDYYKSVRQSPNIPFDSSKLPKKTNLKPYSPSPINPFFKKKLRNKK